ncbi:MAG: dienelactone hydrolase family protein [Rhodospirillaceae bacterium]
MLLKSMVLSAAMVVAAPAAMAAMVEQPITYELDGTSFEGVLVYEDSVTHARPAVMMVPNWLGVTEASIDKAKRLAGSDYVILVADVYGVGVRPQNSEEAGQAAGALRADRPLLRARANKSLDVLLEQAGSAPIDTDAVGAIGFCFGGGTVLELARSGRDLDAVVSFHGNLDTPNADDAKAITAGVLVLHGADDPFVPPEQVQAFEVEMKNAGVADWQVVQFGGAVHSFTDPFATLTGKAEYNERVSVRSFRIMNDYFDETL